MEVVDTFIKKMHEVSKNKKANTFNPRILPLVKEFPFVCGLDIEMTFKNKKFTHEAWLFAELILTQFPLIPLENTTLSEIFQVLTIVGSFQGDIPYSPNYKIMVNTLLQNIAEDNNTHSQLSALTTLFMFPTFVNSYFFSNYFTVVLKNLFSTEELSNSFYHFTKLFSSLVKFVSPNAQKSYNIINFIVIALKDNQVKDINKPSAALFLAAFVQKVSSNSDILGKFISIDGPSTGYDAVKINSASIKTYFKSLLKSANGNDKVIPNILISGYMINLLKSEPTEAREQILLSLIDIARDTTSSIERMTSIFDLTELLSKNASEPKIQELVVTYAGVLVDKKYLYSDLLTEFFLIDLTDESIQKLSIVLAKIDFSKLNKNTKKAMMTFFFDKKSTEEVGKILSEYSPFCDIYKSLYQTETSRRELMLERAIHMESTLQPKNCFIDFIVQLIQIDSNEDILKSYAKILYENFSPSLFHVLISYLKSNDESVSLFLKINGFELLSEVITQKEITDDMIAEMLIALSSKKFRSDLNQTILDLDEKHRFFNLVPESYQKIFYDNERQYPIKLPVLLPFLDFPPITSLQTDLVNEAKFALPIYHRLGKVPVHSPKIASRYIPIEYAKDVIEKYPPDMIYQERNDNFPLYEFIKGNKNAFISINTPFFGVAFWFKCSFQYHEDLIIFDSKGVKLTLRENILTINWGSSSEKIEINNDVWHFVFIQNSASTFEASVNIMIDGKEYNFDEQCLLNSFTFGSSEKAPDETWHLSTNIRIFESLFNDLSHVDTIFKKGPGYIELSKYDEFTGNFTQGFKMNEGVSFVPFNDLSSAIRIPEILSKFFHRLNNTTNSDELDVLIEKGILLNSMSEPIPNFWYYLITVLKNKADIVKPATYRNICKIVLKESPSEEFIDIARSIFLDIELWSKHSYEDNSKMLKIISTFLEKEEMKVFIIQQGWISFFISMGYQTKDYHTQILYFDFVLNLSSKHLLQEPLLILSYISFFDQKVFPEFKNLYLKFVSENPESVVFIPPTWFIDSLETSQNLEYCLNLMKALYSLRKISPSFDMPINAVLIKFTESKEFWDNILKLFDNTFKNVLPFLLSQLLQYTAISVYAYSTGQQCNINDEIVKEGYIFINESIQKKPELFRDDDVINTVCLFSLIIAGIIHPDELHAYLNSTEQAVVTSDSTKVNTEFVTKQLNKVWCLQNNNEKEIKKDETKKLISLGEEIINQMVKESKRIGIDTEKPTICFSSSFLIKSGFSNFIFQLITINSQNQLTSKLIQMSVLFQPLPSHIINIKWVSKILTSFLKLHIQLSESNLTKFIQSLIVAIERDSFSKYIVLICPRIIEYLASIRIYNISDDLITLLCMLSEGILSKSKEALMESLNKGKEFLTDERFAQTPFSLSILKPILENMKDNDLSDFIFCLYRNVLATESFTKRITEKITGSSEDTTKLLNFFEKYSKKEEIKEIPQSIISRIIYMLDQTKSDRTSSMHDDSGNEEYRNLTKQTLSKQFSKEMIDKVISPKPLMELRNLVQLTKMISMRQCECFSISVWQNENVWSIYKNLAREIDNLSVTPIGFSTVPFVDVNDIKMKQKIAEYDDFWKEVGLEPEETFYLDYYNTELVDPSKYGSSCTRSPKMILQSLIRRFYKFGEFRGFSRGFLSEGKEEEEIPITILFFSPGILILLYSEAEGDGIVLKKVKNLSVINKAIRNRFGSITMFSGRPILILNPFDVGYFKKSDSEFTIYPLYVDYFTIKTSDDSGLLFESLKTGTAHFRKISPESQALFDNSLVEKKWANREISHSDLLVLVSRNLGIRPPLSPVPFDGIYPIKEVNEKSYSEIVNFLRKKVGSFGEKARLSLNSHKMPLKVRRKSVGVIVDGEITLRPEFSDASGLTMAAGLVRVSFGTGSVMLYHSTGRSAPARVYCGL